MREGGCDGGVEDADFPGKFQGDAFTVREAQDAVFRAICEIAWPHGG